MAGVDDVVDITDMPIYADGSFDFFMCSHVLEHVSDDGLALNGAVPGIGTRWERGIIMTPVVPQGRFDEDPAVTDEGSGGAASPRATTYASMTAPHSARESGERS